MNISKPTFSEQITISPINMDYHGGKSGFCEQMSALYFAGVDDDHVKFIRSFISIGSAGLSSFDPDAKGGDTFRGWEILDNLIENHAVRGTFHTHPQGFVDFSEQDWKSMISLAQCHGRKMLFHGVQALGQSSAKFVCLHMIKGQIICQNIGWVECEVVDPVVILPCVQAIGHVQLAGQDVLFMS